MEAVRSATAAWVLDFAPVASSGGDVLEGGGPSLDKCDLQCYPKASLKQDTKEALFELSIFILSVRCELTFPPSSTVTLVVQVSCVQTCFS